MYNSLSFIIGHFIGDYLLQSHKQALGKSKSGAQGQAWCCIHCSLYSAAVAFCVVVMDGWKCCQSTNMVHSFLFAWVIAFITHYPIDRYSLGWKWMKMMKQTNFADTIEEVVEEDEYGTDSWIKVKNPRAFFVPIVYVAVDNTMHIVLMWLAYSFLGAH